MKDLTPWINLNHCGGSYTRQEIVRVKEYISVIEGTAPPFVLQTFDSPNLSPPALSDSQEKPHCLPRNRRLPRLPIIFVWGEKTPLFALPFPIFDLVHMQVILSNFWYRWTAVYPNSFYPVTALPIKRTAVTRTACYPVTWLPVHTLFLHVHHAFYYYSPK